MTNIDVTKLPEAPSPEAPEGLSVSKMPAVAQAGVDLAKFVLVMAAGSIVILATGLIFSELNTSSSLNGAYSKAINEVSAIKPDDARDELVLAELRRARLDPSWNVPKEMLPEAKAALQSLSTGGTLSDAQKTTLASCIPIPDPAHDRNSVLDRCISTLHADLSDSDQSPSKIKAIVDLAKQAGDQQQLFRTFWIQAAQLILLNLLLPLLTALFGYIFGTSQAQKSA